MSLQAQMSRQIGGLAASLQESADGAWRMASRSLKILSKRMRSGGSPCKGVYDDCAVLATRKNVLPLTTNWQAGMSINWQAGSRNQLTGQESRTTDSAWMAIYWL